MERFKEWLAIKIAWLLPRRVVYWAAVRVHAHATQGRFGMDDPNGVTILEASRRWGLAN